MSAGVETATYQVSAITCPSCEEHVRHGVSGIDGVIDVSADYTTSKAVVRLNRGRTDTEAIRRTIDATGCQVKVNGKD